MFVDFVDLIRYKNYDALMDNNADLMMTAFIICNLSSNFSSDSFIIT